MKLKILFVMLALAMMSSHAGFAQEASDIKIKNVNCWADGSGLSQNALSSLWNPSGTADAVRGSPFSHDWSGAGELRCRYELEQLTPWIAMEVVPASGGQLLSVVAIGQDGFPVSLVDQPISFVSERKIRVNSDRVLGIIALEITLGAVCTSGSCSIKLSELRPFPEVLDVSALHADGKDAVFPNEDFAVRGSVSERDSTCVGERNDCLWVSHEDCVCNKKKCNKAYLWSTPFAGPGCCARKCDLQCPTTSSWQGDFVQYLSSQGFRSGGCERKGWLRPTNQAIAAIGAVALLVTSAAGALGPVLYPMIVGAMSALAIYNPSYSWSAQWKGMVIIFVIKAVMTYVQMSILEGIPPEAVMFNNIVNAFEEGGLWTGITQVLYYAGMYAVNQVVQTVVIQPLTAKIIASIGADNAISQALVSAFTGALGGALSSTIGAAFGYAFTQTAHGILDVDLSSSMQEMYDVDFGTFMEMTLERSAIGFIENGFRSAATKIAAIPLKEMCNSAAQDKATFDVSGICSTVGETMAGWFLFANKTSFFDTFGVSVPPLNLRYVADELNISSALGSLTTGPTVAAKISDSTTDYITKEQQANIGELEKYGVSAEEIIAGSNKFLKSVPAGLSGLSSDEKKYFSEKIDEIVFKGEGDYDAGPIERRLQALNDLRGWINSAQVANDVWREATAVSNMYNSVKESIGFMRDIKQYEKSAAKQQAEFVKGEDCACFGSLRSHPQFRLEPVACTNGDVGMSSTSAGRPLYIIGASEVIGPPENPITGLVEQGIGWCEIPASDGKVGKGGSVTANVGKASFASTFDKGYFGVAARAPNQTGRYILNVTATHAAPIAIVDEARKLLGKLNLISSEPLTLLSNANSTARIAAALTSPELANVKSQLESLANLLTAIAGRTITLSPEFSSKIADLRTSLMNLASNTSVVEDRATASGYNSTLGGLTSATLAAVDKLDALSAQPNASNAIGAERALSEARLLTIDLRSLPDSVPLMLVAAAQEMRTVPNTVFNFSWYEYELYAGEWVLYDEPEIRLSFANMSAVHTVGWSNPTRGYWLNGTWHEGYYAQRNIEYGTFIANLSDLVDTTESAAAKIDALSNVTRDAVAAADITPALALAIAGIDDLKRSIDEKINAIKPVLDAIGGTEDELEGTLTLGHVSKCEVWSHSHFMAGSSTTLVGVSYVYVNEQCLPCPRGRGLVDYRCSRTDVSVTVNRMALAVANEGIGVLRWLSERLKDARNWATDAVYSAQLRPIMNATVAEMFGARDWLSDVAKLAINQTEIANAVNATGIGAMVEKLSGAVVEGRQTVAVDVVRPDIKLSSESNVMCGAGEPLRYDVTIAVDATWPTFNITANWWTPFSVPYVPRTTITLRDIAPRCDVRALVWWNADSQSATKVETNASSVALVSGRGYYILTANDCTIQFAASKFSLSANARINLSAVGNTIGTAPSFIGSAGYSIPYDTDSLSHKMFNAWDLYSDQLNRNCSQLGYELYYSATDPDDRLSNFMINKTTGNWSWLVEARPMQTEPFVNGSSPVGEFSDMIRPGRAYWIWSNRTCSLQTRLPGILQTVNDYGPKPVTFNVTLGLPSGWSGRVIADEWSDIDDMCRGLDNAAMCTSVGSAGVKRQIEITPASTGEFGENIISIAVSNSTYGVNATATVRYALQSSAPMIDAAKLHSQPRTIYDFNITSTSSDLCQARTNYLAVEGPLGWNVTQSMRTFNLPPGSVANANATLFPLPALATSGWFTALASSSASERTKSEANIFEPLCIPEGFTLDIATNGTHLLYSSEDGIHLFNVQNCSDAMLVSGGLPYGIAYADGKVFWIDGAMRKIRSYDTSNKEISYAANVSDASDVWYVAADSQAVYWVDNRTIRRVALSDGTTTVIAENLDEPTGLDVDSQYAYWTEPAKIRRVPKTGSCSGDGCSIVTDISAYLLGPSPGRLQDVAADGQRLFVAVSNLQGSRDYSKIIVINDDTTDIVTNPVMDAWRDSGVTGIAVDGSYVYWASGSTDRISKWARAAVFSDYLTVAGHNPSIARMTPSVLTTIAGVPVKFTVTAVNNNSAISPSPSDKFWIKDVQLPDGIELCASKYECESANEFGASFGRQALLARYASKYKWIDRNNSKTFELWLKPKGSLATNSNITFNITVGGIDSAMDGHASAALHIIAPSGPQVEVIPMQPWPCRSGEEWLEPGFANQSCAVRYEIIITNPEELEASYSIDVAAPNYWTASVEADLVSIPGRLSVGLGWNQRSVILNASPTLIVPFGAWQFDVNVTNVAFPEKQTITAFDIVVTPDNMNGVCEPELGENATNTLDCRSEFICGFGNRCDNTTAWGVDWSARLASGDNMTAFGVCEWAIGESRDDQIKSCFDEFGRAERTNLICSSTTDFCRLNCAERSGKYMLIAKTANSNVSSRAFRYNCPACIGDVFSPIVKADLNLQRWRPELASGMLSFSDWLKIVGDGEFLYAMAWQPSDECVSVTKSVVDRGRTLERTAAETVANVAYPVDGQCALVRATINEFVNTSERMIESVCRRGVAALTINRIDVPKATLGTDSSATVEIENIDDVAHVQARCTFEQPRMRSRIATSDCKLLGSGGRANFSVPIPALGLGNWNVRCDAGWSMFTDCSVVVGVASRNANLTVVLPNTSLQIVSRDIPRYGVQGEIIIIRIDVNNSGENANASAECTLKDSNGAVRTVESDIKLVSFGRVMPFRINFRPDSVGEWSVESCSVYKVSSRILHQIIQIGASLLVWPACTATCQQHGWDFGACFSNATADVSGEQGCLSNEQCVCGFLNVTQSSCERIGSTGSIGLYKELIRVNWQTGNYLRLGGTLFQSPTFEWTRQVQGGSYTENATIYKGSTPIYYRTIELKCIGLPQIDIPTIPDNTVINGLVIIRPAIVDANATLYIDDMLIGTLNNSGYIWNTTTVSDGEHTIKIIACNAAGCAETTRTVRVQNELVLPQYTFSIDPSSLQTDVRAGEIASFIFIIKNIGSTRDTYTLTDDLSSAWSRAVAMNGAIFARTITLDVGQQALFSVNVSVPSIASIGQSAGLTIRATSAIGRMIKSIGPYNIRVSEVSKTTPELVNVWHSLLIAHRGENLTFNIQLNQRGSDIITDVRVCRDAACSAVWCYATAGISSGAYSCTISAPVAGNYSYWILARTAGGSSILSSERNFYVSTLTAGPVSQANVAAKAAANASTSIAEHDASKAVDEDPSTYWISESPLPQWLQVDLKRQMWIGGIGIYSASPARPKSFDVLVGDCTNFQRAYTERSARYSENWYRVAFDAMLGKCVRLNVIETEDGSPYAAVASFEVYEGQPSAPRVPETCGNGVCDTGETTENCMADCTPQPTEGPSAVVWILIIGVAVVIALLSLPRIALWLEYIRG